MMAINLLQYASFKSHSGLTLPWKIDCDALADEDIETIAKIINDKFKFSRVIGIARGGLRLMEALRQYCLPGPEIDHVLIVDDVMTTGKSMVEAYRAIRADGITAPITGVVIFSRGPQVSWVHSLFVVSDWANL